MESGAAHTHPKKYPSAPPGVCDTKEVVKLKDPFLKELLRYWAETNLVNQVSSEIVIQERKLMNQFLPRVARVCDFSKIRNARGTCLDSEAERLVPARQHSTALNWFEADTINFDGRSILQGTLIKVIWTSSTVKR